MMVMLDDLNYFRGEVRALNRPDFPEARWTKQENTIVGEPVLSPFDGRRYLFRVIVGTDVDTTKNEQNLLAIADLPRWINLVDDLMVQLEHYVDLYEKDFTMIPSAFSSP